MERPKVEDYMQVRTKYTGKKSVDLVPDLYEYISHLEAENKRLREERFTRLEVLEELREFAKEKCYGRINIDFDSTWGGFPGFAPYGSKLESLAEELKSLSGTKQPKGE